MSISDSIPEMPANTSGTYSIMIRANLESDDILITSNKQLAFGQKLQVCCFVNMNSIRLTKKNKTLGGQQCLNTEKYWTWSGLPRKYRIQNTTVYRIQLQEFLGECNNASSQNYIKEDFFYHRLIECTKRWSWTSTKLECCLNICKDCTQG